MIKRFGKNSYSIHCFCKKLYHIPLKAFQILFSSYMFPFIVNKITEDKQQYQSAQISAIILCLMYCNFLNGKPIWNYIYLPNLVSLKHFWNTYRTNSLLAEIWSKYKLWSFWIYFPSSICLFLLDGFSLYQTKKIFLPT